MSTSKDISALIGHPDRSVGSLKVNLRAQLILILSATAHKPTQKTAPLLEKNGRLQKGDYYFAYFFIILNKASMPAL